MIHREKPVVGTTNLRARLLVAGDTTLGAGSLMAVAPYGCGGVTGTGGEPAADEIRVEHAAVVEVYADVRYFDTALTRTARLDDIEALVRRFG